MDSTFEQTSRHGVLYTTGESNVLNLEVMRGTESLSGDFTWEIDAVSTEFGLDLNDFLGNHATVMEHKKRALMRK